MTDLRLQLPEGLLDPTCRLQVAAPFAPLYPSPESDQSQLTELVFGQRFDVHDETGSFFLGRVVPLLPGSTRQGYVGWVKRDSLGPEGAATTHRVSSLSAPLFTRSDLKSPIRMSLPAGSLLSVTSIVGEGAKAYLQTDQGTWVSARHVVSTDEFASDIVAAARLYLGQPYIWGGNGARGVDCSGLVQMACMACGIDAPRDADMQEQILGEPASKPEKPGDLLFWKGHVGLLSRVDTLLHANAFHMGVVEEPLGQALDRMEASGLPLRTVRRLP